ncbi:MAG: hypothetical protein HY996_11095 [Micrococcales bacterium]|nr:hypothetical protein [Micrococcales bacterium]
MSSPGTALTFVTVFYGAEMDLLRLQARSLARRLDPDGVRGIVVIDNGWPPVPPAARNAIRTSYGPLADRVSFLRSRDVAASAPATEGWRSQQLLKLLIARRVETPYYVVLDAKNHLIGPADLTTFVGPDGRAHLATHPYTTHPLRAQLATAVRYLGGDDDDVVAAESSSVPTATPFVMSTQLTLDMMHDVATTAGARFETIFERYGLTEFLLYGSWLDIRGPGRTTIYDGVDIPSPTVWPSRRSIAGVEATIAEAEAAGSAFFAVHRQALAKSNPEVRSRIAQFWASRGLFSGHQDAARFIRSFRRHYPAAMLATRAAERVRELTKAATPGARQLRGSTDPGPR